MSAGGRQRYEASVCDQTVRLTMPRFLIDANLPCSSALWRGDDYVHVRDLDPAWSDAQVWEYARSRGLVIVSKDADFSDRAMMSEPPPRVVHVCVGNVRLQAFNEIVAKQWPWIVANMDRFRLIRMYSDRIETVSVHP